MNALSMTKAILRNVSPTTYTWLREQILPYPRLSAKIARLTGLRVAHGPFRGMMYPNVRASYRITPKLIGSYEHELASVFDELMKLRFRLIVNVGCAEGYYAVGLARAFPGVPVIAYDPLDEMRRRCCEMAELNGVAEQIELRGACLPEELERLALEESLMVMDCEGFERELLIGTHAELDRTHLVVEVHEWTHPGLSDMLVAQFGRTHVSRLFYQQPRDSDEFPVLQRLSDTDKKGALEEDRQVDGQRLPQHWLYLKPRAQQLC